MKARLPVYAKLMYLAPNLCFAGDFVIIANKSVAETPLGKKVVSDIYLGKKSTWSDGGKIEFLCSRGRSMMIS